jgi:hypothetical protein
MTGVLLEMSPAEAEPQRVSDRLRLLQNQMLTGSPLAARFASCARSVPIIQACFISSPFAWQLKSHRFFVLDILCDKHEHLQALSVIVIRMTV